MTFLLISGSSLIIDAGLRWIGDIHTADAVLSAFSISYVLSLMIHSPLFCTREIVITVVRDGASLRVTGRFLAIIAAAMTALELCLALSPLGNIVFGWMTRDHTIIEAARMNLLVLAAVPSLITVRGISQALLIVNDRSRLVGLSTATRVTLTIGGMLLGVWLIPGHGAVLGGLVFTTGVLCETVVAHILARRERSQVRIIPNLHSEGMNSVSRFASPLMLGNLLGMVPFPICLAVAGMTQVDTANSSIAAFRLISTLAMLVGAPLFTLQALMTAKGDRRESRITWSKFAALAATAGFSLFALAMLCRPIRDYLMGHLLHAPPGSDTHAFALAAIPIAIWFPLGTTAKATLRGILIRQRKTTWLLVCTVLGIIPPLFIYAWANTYTGGDPTSLPVNRSDDAYWGMLLALVTELLFLIGMIIKKRENTDRPKL